MKRLMLTVEGQTEAAFVTKVLAPHLANFNVVVGKPRLTGLHKRRRGRIPSGGMLNTFGHALADMQTWLTEDQGDDARFSMMVDLFSLPNDFPGYATAMAINDPHAQVQALEASLDGVMHDSRFISYLQLHEFEALVLVDPERISCLYEGCDRQLKKLAKECAEFDTPEHINHGQHTHPKYRIKQAVPDYHENVDGPELADDIGIETLRSTCKHFNDWLTVLEQLDK